MLSPFEQNTTIGDRMLRRSIRVPSDALYATGSEILAHKQLVDDELNLLCIQIYVATPPFFEVKIARRLCVDLGIKVVLFAPQSIGRIFLALEILHQPGTIKFSVAKVACQSG